MATNKSEVELEIAQESKIAEVNEKTECIKETMHARNSLSRASLPANLKRPCARSMVSIRKVNNYTSRMSDLQIGDEEGAVG